LDFLDAEFDQRIRLNWSARSGYSLVTVKHIGLNVRWQQLACRQALAEFTQMVI
jgi:hypothetical protein